MGDIPPGADTPSHARARPWRSMLPQAPAGLGLDGRGKGSARIGSTASKFYPIVALSFFAHGCRQESEMSIRETEGEPSRKELIALIAALRAENASLKARLAELERRLALKNV